MLKETVGRGRLSRIESGNEKSGNRLGHFGKVGLIIPDNQAQFSLEDLQSERMNMTPALVLVLLFLTQDVDDRTDTLLRNCERLISGTVSDRSDAMNVGYCFGYLSAISDSRLFTPSPWYCAPDSVTLGQVIRVFVSWAQKHPELHHQYMAISVERALKEAFPCKMQPLMQQPTLTPADRSKIIEQVNAETRAAIAEFTKQYPDWKQYEQTMLKLSQIFLLKEGETNIQYMKRLYDLAKQQ